MKTVFFDVDTQLDFLFPAGALYAPGAEHVAGVAARLNQWAAANGVLVVSTMDAHSENDPEFRSWPPHCVTGTTGQTKPTATLLEPRVTVPSHATNFSLEGAAQVILEKQHVDAFTNANLAELLRRLDADCYVVYGVVTEVCVRHAALGLLKTGKRVEVLTDAVRHLREQDAQRFFAEFTAAGGRLRTS